MRQALNLVIVGQKEFGRLVLDMAISEGHHVVGVFAPLANGTGGVDRLQNAAHEYRLNAHPLGDLRAEHIPRGTDLIVSAASHAFVGPGLRARTSLGAIGYHPSLLPLHRGRDAIEWTIRFRERVAGGTVYWLDDVCDGGPVAAQRHCFVRPEDTARTLWERELCPLGVQLLREVLCDLAHGHTVKRPQDEALATYEPAVNVRVAAQKVA